MKKTIIILLIIIAITITACQSNTTNTNVNEAPNTIQKETNTENNNITTETTQAKTEENTEQTNEQTTKEGTITIEELRKHNNENDCYIGYKGTAYDITNWINKHPGGTGIKEYCGTTTEFEQALQKQHGTSKEAMLEKVGTKIGTITK